MRTIAATHCYLIALLHTNLVEHNVQFLYNAGHIMVL